MRLCGCDFKTFFNYSTKSTKPVFCINGCHFTRQFEAPFSTLQSGQIQAKKQFIISYVKHPQSSLNAVVFVFKVEEMMEGIIQAFKDRVTGVGWIDNQTVQAVREKVSERQLVFGEFFNLVS